MASYYMNGMLKGDREQVKVHIQKETQKEIQTAQERIEEQERLRIQQLWSSGEGEG